MVCQRFSVFAHVISNVVRLSFIKRRMNQNLNESSDLYRKARQLMDENQLDEAVVLFQRSADIDAHFKTLELLGECYVLLNAFQKAIIPLAAAVSLNKGVRAASLLADVFLKLKNYSAAENMAEIALSREPNNRKALEIKKIVANINGDAQQINGHEGETATLL